MTTHNTHNRQTSMTPVGFEPTVSAGERPKTYALDRAAIGTGPTAMTSANIFTFYGTGTALRSLLFWDFKQSRFVVG